MTSVIITSIICVSFVIICVTSDIAKTIDRNNYYKAKGEHPEAFKINEFKEDK